MHRATYEAVFQEPCPAELDWKSVRAMLMAISTAAAPVQGVVRLTRRGRTFAIHADRHKGRIADEDVKLVRRFLEGPTGPEAAATAAGARLVVLVSSGDARVFRIGPGADGREALLPFDPCGVGRTLVYVQDRPDSVPDAGREGFDEALSRVLRGAADVVIMARGKTAGPGAKRLADYLGGPRSMISARVTSVVMMDPNPTPEQVLAKVKQALPEE
ncbi:MAG: hypothetical protein AB7K52_02955 [Phycisphaerales bacterium]